MRSAALAALLAALAPAAADGAGFRLDRLGAPKGLTLHGQTAAGGVGFVLPSDAVQGRPLW